VEPIAANRDQRNIAYAKGLILLARRDFSAAISRLMETHSSLSPNVQHEGILTAHVPLWSALGQAHLASGREKEALPWFKKVNESITEHIYEPIDYVRSFYFLGKIYEQQGDMPRARDYYRRFVEQWKDGDLDRERIAEAQKKIAN
jgi:tetratricopeptide (TPR) repeat protein